MNKRKKAALEVLLVRANPGTSALPGVCTSPSFILKAARITDGYYQDCKHYLSRK